MTFKKPLKEIRFKIDEYLYDEVVRCARKNGYGRQQMSQFYKEALEYYVKVEKFGLNIFKK
jgi:hypothetical protein